MTSPGSREHSAPPQHPPAKKLSVGSVHHSLALEEMVDDDGLDLEHEEIGTVEVGSGAERDARDWQESNDQDAGSQVTGSVAIATGYTANGVLDCNVAKADLETPSSEQGEVEIRQHHVPQDFDTLVRQFKKRASWKEGLVAAKEKEGAGTGGGDGGVRKTSWVHMAKELALERGKHLWVGQQSG